jgi:hypothetical protein
LTTDAEEREAATLAAEVAAIVARLDPVPLEVIERAKALVPPAVVDLRSRDDG